MFARSASILLCLTVAQIRASALTEELHANLIIQSASVETRVLPITVLIPVEGFPEGWNLEDLSATVKATDGRMYPACAKGRTVGEDRVVLMWLDEGFSPRERRIYEVRIAPRTGSPALPGFTIRDASAGPILTENSVPVLQWMSVFDPERAEETKKVFTHLWDPAGGRRLTKGPGGKYSHHRGLFLGYKKVTLGEKTWDSWHMPEADNTQVGEVPGTMILNPVSGQNAASIEWRDPDGNVYLNEMRLIEAYRATPDGRLLDIKTNLVAPGDNAGDLHLDGDLHHGGFQFRADNEVAAKTEALTEFIFPKPDAPGEFLHLKYPEGKPVLGKDSPWGCMMFTLGQQRYGVLYMCHPKSKRPAEFSIRYYGRFGEFFPCVLGPGKNLLMNYRLFVFQGEKEPAFLQSVYNGYAHKPEVRVEKVTWKERLEP